MSLCNIRQIRISGALDDGRELPPSLQKHVDACPRCSRFLAQSVALDEHLAKAPAATPQTPAWMHTKIMAGVHASSPIDRRSGRPAWLPAAGGIAALAILVALITLKSPEGELPAPETAEVQISTPVPPVHPASVPARIEKHAKLALSTEFHKLATDISGARRFLSASLRNTIPGLGED